VTVTIDAVLIRAGEQMLAVLGDQEIVPGIGCLGSNRTAGEIWNMLREHRRVGDICSTLSELYDVDVAAKFHDIIHFLQKMIARRAVRAVGPDGAR
jgi:Coenzyme PQQ synthesis protein D (PqqD)